ncbi:hypothetical protein ACFL29_00305 [Patescibacteria group bacterium]
MIARDVNAYVDPGTGSMLLQIIVGMVAGSIYVGRRYFVLFFRRIFNRKNKEKAVSTSLTETKSIPNDETKTEDG